VGVCVRCRLVICAGCCTRLDGVNHCHACLKALGASPDVAPAAGLRGVTALALLGLGWLVLVGLFWFGQGLFVR
jgi:hypothetical protein